MFLLYSQYFYVLYQECSSVTIRWTIAFSQLTSFSTMPRGKHKPCRYGAGMVKSRWAGTPSYAKTTDLSRSIFSSARKSPKHRHSIHYPGSCRGKHLIGNIAMLIVKFRPRWPHTWRYGFHSLSHPTMTSGRLGQMYSRSRRRTHSGKVPRECLNKFRPILFLLFNGKYIFVY